MTKCAQCASSHVAGRCPVSMLWFCGRECQVAFIEAGTKRQRDEEEDKSKEKALAVEYREIFVRFYGEDALREGLRRYIEDRDTDDVDNGTIYYKLFTVWNIWSKIFKQDETGNFEDKEYYANKTMSPSMKNPFNWYFRSIHPDRGVEFQFVISPTVDLSIDTSTGMVYDFYPKNGVYDSWDLFKKIFVRLFIGNSEYLGYREDNYKHAHVFPSSVTLMQNSGGHDELDKLLAHDAKPFYMLPKDVLRYIATMDVKVLLSMAQTNTSFALYARNPAVWRYMFERDYRPEFLWMGGRTSRVLEWPETTPNVENAWKRIYLHVRQMVKPHASNDLQYNSKLKLMFLFQKIYDPSGNRNTYGEIYETDLQNFIEQYIHIPLWAIIYPNPDALFKLLQRTEKKTLYKLVKMTSPRTFAYNKKIVSWDTLNDAGKNAFYQKYATEIMHLEEHVMYLIDFNMRLISSGIRFGLYDAWLLHDHLESTVKLGASSEEITTLVQIMDSYGDTIGFYDRIHVLESLPIAQQIANANQAVTGEHNMYASLEHFWTARLKFKYPPRNARNQLLLCQICSNVATVQCKHDTELKFCTPECVAKYFK